MEEVVEEAQEKSSSDRGGAWGLGGAATAKNGPFGLEPDTPHQRRYMSTTTLPTPTPRPIRMPFDPPSPPDTAKEDEERIFQIHTSRANRNFRDQINMGHYHGNFAIDGKMVGQGDLAKRVPVVGMSCVDWRARQRPWRFVKMEGEGREGRERLGVIWEREGKAKAEVKAKEVNERKVDAFGDVEMEKGWRGRKRVQSWSDNGMR